MRLTFYGKLNVIPKSCHCLTIYAINSVGFSATVKARVPVIVTLLAKGKPFVIEHIIRSTLYESTRIV